MKIFLKIEYNNLEIFLQKYFNKNYDKLIEQI